jgi:hypothetical protein
VVDLTEGVLVDSSQAKKVQSLIGMWIPERCTAEVLEAIKGANNPPGESEAEIKASTVNSKPPREVRND